MSWLGGLNDSFTQLSSLTGQIGGQISNFTKEVLTETAEDNIDYEVEAKRLAEELKQNEAIISNLKQENSQLKEKVHTAELRVSTTSIEHEARIQEKLNEIKQLKQKLETNGAQLHNEAGLHALSFSNVSLNDDDDNFHDVINYQREINRLSRELEEAQSEAKVWKEKTKSTRSETSAAESVGQNADASLRSKIKELESELRREVDHHQQELRTIQAAHAAAVGRYQDEIRKLKRNVPDSPESLPATNDGGFQIHKQEREKLESELNSLKEQMRTRNRQLQVQKNQLEGLNSDLKERESELELLKESKRSVVDEREKLRSESERLDAELKMERDQLQGITDRLFGVLSADDIPVEFDQGNVSQSLASFIRFYHNVAEEKVHVLAENAQFQSDIETLQDRVMELERVVQSTGRRIENEEREESLYDAELAESDQWHQDGVRQVAEEDQNFEQADAESDQHHKRRLLHNLDFGSPIGHSSPHVFSSTRSRVRPENRQPTQPEDPGDLTLTLQALQKQVEDYELEIEQYEQVQSEWQTEKKSLQELLNRYQNEVGQAEGQQPEDERAVAVEKLKQELNVLWDARAALEKETNRLLHEKEQLQAATRNLEEELNVSISETQAEKDQADVLKQQLEKYAQEREKLQTAYDVLTQELNRSREEKEDLDQALDALDTQHQDEMAQLLSVRDDLKAQLKNTENQLKEEKVEKDAFAKELENLKREMAEKSLNREMSSELDEEVNSLRNRLSGLEQEKRILESKVRDSESNFAKLKDEGRNTDILNENLKHDLERVEKEKMHEVTALSKKLQSQLKDGEVKCSELQNKLLEAYDKLKSFEKRQKDDRECLDQKDVQIANLQSQMESCRAALKEEDSLQTSSPVQQEVIGDLKNEITTLNTSLAEKENQLEMLKNKMHTLEERLVSETARFQDEIEGLGSELENAGREMAEMQASHEEEVRKTQREHQDVKEKVLKEAQLRVSAFEEDRESLRKEGEATNKVYQEKIAHLEKENADLHEKLDDLAEHKTKVLAASQESETLALDFKQQHAHLTEKYNAILKEHDALVRSTQNEKDLLESRLKAETEEKIRSQKESSEVKNLLRKVTDSEASLASELAALKVDLEHSKLKITSLSKKDSEKENDEKDYSSNDIVMIKKTYETKVNSLLDEIKELKNHASAATLNKRPNVDVEKMLDDLRKHDLAGLEKSDLSKDDIGSLLRFIKERDDVIEVLCQKRAADGPNSATSFAEIQHLKDANRSLSAEKDQILAVISEKTRENKKLKDEAHKTMGIIAESKAALEKVQQENAALLAKYEGYDREMTREAITKLSRLVMEKELEIESLKQKCGTLLEVLQQQPGGGSALPENVVSGQQVQNLLRDKETLTGQVQQLLTERNHLLALLNQRQVEVEEARSEVSKAAEALERDADDNSKLQIDYSNLVHEYEQTQIKLQSIQKEFLPLKEKSADLEKLKGALLRKLDAYEETKQTVVSESMQTSSDHVSTLGGAQTDSNRLREIKVKLDQTSETLAQREFVLRQLNEENSRKNEEIEKLQNDSREKDLLIHAKLEETSRAKKDLAAKTNEVEILRKSVENLRDQVASLSKNCEEARAEVRNFSTRLGEKDAESQAFQETNAQLSMLLKEKEYELENVKEKCQRLEAMAKEDQQGKETESQRLLVELDNSKQAIIAARHERDQVMLALKQRKIEADKYAEEARICRETEAKLESELARLRNHLIQVEEAYTQEAVLAEDREASLREQLQQTRSTQNAVREASELSQQQAESLQEQLRAALGQRDHAIHQLQMAQEQGMQYATALQKLQVAVERMQREEAANFAEQLEKINRQLEAKTNDADIYETMANDLKSKLENANDALKSASRLNKQLELKEENITQLKNIVAEKQLQIDGLQDKMHLVLTKSEGMVDKEIMKNLVIGYFTSPNNKRPDVLHLISGVLGFSREETQKVNSGGSQGARAWIGGWLWRGDGAQRSASASVPASPRRGNVNESFTQMFVKFLENESVPHQAAKLPTATMISEAQQKLRAPRSPVLSSVPTPVGYTAAERAGPTVAGRYSPFLLSTSTAATPQRGEGSTTTVASPPVAPHPITPMLPTFTPIISPKPAAEQEILQDILLSTSDR